MLAVMVQKDGACINMAWLMTQVEEAECGVENQKALTFRGKGPGPPGAKVSLNCHVLEICIMMQHPRHTFESRVLSSRLHCAEGMLCDKI